MDSNLLLLLNNRNEDNNIHSIQFSTGINTVINMDYAILLIAAIIMLSLLLL